METRKNALERLQSHKAELSLKCKAKGEEINKQTDYIAEHFGEITIKSIIGNRFKKGSETKTEIIKILVADTIETVVNIKNNPTHVKDSLIDFAKKTGTGVLNLLFK